MKAYENLFRPAYEAIAAAVWILATFAMFYVSLVTDYSSSALWYMGGIAANKIACKSPCGRSCNQ